MEASLEEADGDFDFVFLLLVFFKVLSARSVREEPDGVAQGKEDEENKSRGADACFHKYRLTKKDKKVKLKMK